MLAFPGIAFPPKPLFPNIFLQFFPETSKISKMSRAYVVIIIDTKKDHTYITTLRYHTVLSIYRRRENTINDTLHLDNLSEMACLKS